MRIRDCHIVVTSWMLLLFVCPPVTADDLDDFRIQDYVPERYVDLRWETRGSTSANDRDSEDDMAGPDPYRLEVDNHQGVFRLNLEHGSSFDVRYYTRYQRLQARLSYDIQGNWIRQDQTEHSVDSVLGTMHTSTRQSTFDDNEYRLSSVLSFSGQQYLTSSLFASAELGAAWNGWFEPDNYGTLFENEVIGSADTIWTYFTERSIDRYTDEKRASWTAEVSGGLGRVEEGSWTYTALTMLHTLKRAGVLIHPISKRQIVAFCDSISVYRIASPFDMRDHRQQALAALASFLVAESLVVSVDPATLLSMQDIWDYYPDVSRSFGWRAAIGLGGSFSRRSRQSQFDEHRHEISTIVVGSNPPAVAFDSTVLLASSARSIVRQEELHLLSTIEIHKPLSLRWQGFGTASTTLNLDHSAVTNGPFRVAPFTDFSCIGSLGVNYYYDARSSFGLRFQLQYDRLKYELVPADRPFPDRYRALTVNGYASATYRLSKPTSFGLSLGVEHHDRRRRGNRVENNTEYLTVTFVASISHFLL